MSSSYLLTQYEDIKCSECIKKCFRYLYSVVLCYSVVFLISCCKLKVPIASYLGKKYTWRAAALQYVPERKKTLQKSCVCTSLKKIDVQNSASSPDNRPQHGVWEIPEHSERKYHSQHCDRRGSLQFWLDYPLGEHLKLWHAFLLLLRAEPSK